MVDVHGLSKVVLVTAKTPHILLTLSAQGVVAEWNISDSLLDFPQDQQASQVAQFELIESYEIPLRAGDKVRHAKLDPSTLQLALSLYNSQKPGLFLFYSLESRGSVKELGQHETLAHQPVTRMDLVGSVLAYVVNTQLIIQIREEGGDYATQIVNRQAKLTAVAVSPRCDSVSVGEESGKILVVELNGARVAATRSYHWHSQRVDFLRYEPLSDANAPLQLLSSGPGEGVVVRWNLGDNSRTHFAKYDSRSNLGAAIELEKTKNVYLGSLFAEEGIE
mmetsp:Transcript_4663/g.7921  ORF Transcript_4663/g.7921 Transcript_4663/m.7921 type:complete len:278 (-) Transcript_4663:1289-2122(-)|eukprot:CAMPEP_0168619652 /NCGR_PEP_ID=MMETSP0449_2-20121227/6714_1 /TAXON_ID=1082188 /ORGANISM="Strombidium rassoulzadegani, Strain ras09" /LENGTH=277 /DNA_ID=CAMNT_0008660597 /DNA_START=228 /DNA_END=1061 /DNA_ORIENTATION=-